MFATERLAFTGGPIPRTRARVTPLEPAAADIPSATLPARERQDRPAYRLLLFFIFVLMFRPQDDLKLLDPLHLAEVSGTLAVLSLIAGRLSRGRRVVEPALELFLVLGLAAWMLLTAPVSVGAGGAVEN